MVTNVTRGPARAAAATLVVGVLTASMASAPASAQESMEGEVRQLVTFRFLPGRAAEATAIFREQAVPLYRSNPAMRSFRGFREVESPVPLDLVVVSAFDGMEGMDASNQLLSQLAGAAGTSIGAIYGSIAALSATHDDQFIAMLPDLSQGDPSANRLVAMVWYRLLPGERARFLRTLREETMPWEQSRGIAAYTGRFLVSDGWHYLRVVGFDSLGEYEAYWAEVARAGHEYIDGITTRRREVILAPVPELSVR